MGVEGGYVENLGDVIEVTAQEVAAAIGKVFLGRSEDVYNFCKQREVIGFRIGQAVYYGYESSDK
ncbi:hypothetical protein COU74_03745 [Candidatus Peregrinibacteria bacterium CG10_big_fil_rev_8_21_14_0_10_36_19]|nr:MAG: hypothetical protein COU74_03745 [Candidatus Peregrinibacteria bacterium CG10_big_fil_rev_8_21_14_0_10_36_19]